MQSCMSISSSSKSLQSLVQFTKFRFEDMTHNPDDSTHVMSLLVSVPTFMPVVMLFMFKSNITYLMVNSYADSFFCIFGIITKFWGVGGQIHVPMTTYPSFLLSWIFATLLLRIQQNENIAWASRKICEKLSFAGVHPPQYFGLWGSIPTIATPLMHLCHVPICELLPAWMSKLGK